VDRLCLGHVARSRGRKGEIVLDQPVDRLAAFPPGSKVTLTPPGEERVVESAWNHNGRAILKFQGVDSIDAAEALRGAEVSVPRAQLGEQLLMSDLVGCRVYDQPSGRELGTVTNWEETGGAELVQLDSGLLIPFARSIFISIEVSQKRIGIRLPEGLEDL
jgi:16S rRNA processing protein RimM